jgi:natural product biosynthesis luciferase-like monooxygenase protein
MAKSVEELLGVRAEPRHAVPASGAVQFSFLFFSDVRSEIGEAAKYGFMREIASFADREGFTAIYLPERHFFEFGSIYANPAIVAAYLIPQTRRIRFRTAGISLPLHHPAEIAEWWAMNDVLSGGRVDLGFGSGWNRADFILAPDNYERRRALCSERISIVQRLWRGETVSFPGPGGERIPIAIHPRPVQPELNVWLLVAQNDEAFSYAGEQGYNVFTMLYGIDLEALGKKISLYREGRRRSGRDPATGIVSLMLHTLVHRDLNTVEKAIEVPFKAYIRNALDAHVNEGVVNGSASDVIDEATRAKMLEYAYRRYCRTGAIFGSVEEGREVVDAAIQAGVNEIACLVDFGVDYATVGTSLPYLKTLVSHYL